MALVHKGIIKALTGTAEANNVELRQVLEGFLALHRTSLGILDAAQRRQRDVLELEQVRLIGEIMDESTKIARFVFVFLPGAGTGRYWRPSRSV